MKYNNDNEERQRLLDLAREEYTLEMQAVNRIEESLLLDNDGETIQRTNDASDRVGMLKQKLYENEQDLMAITLRIERNGNRSSNTKIKKKKKKTDSKLTQIQDVRDRVSKWKQDRERRIHKIERVLQEKEIQDTHTSFSIETEDTTTIARRLDYTHSSLSNVRSLQRIATKLTRQREAKQRASKKKSDETWQNSFERLDRHQRGRITRAAFSRVLRTYICLSPSLSLS